jgi:hypothetical protein
MRFSNQKTRQVKPVNAHKFREVSKEKAGPLKQDCNIGILLRKNNWAFIEWKGLAYLNLSARPFLSINAFLA